MTMNALMLALEQSLALSVILAMKTTAACIVLSKHEPQEQVAAYFVLSGSRATSVLIGVEPSKAGDPLMGAYVQGIKDSRRRDRR